MMQVPLHIPYFDEQEEIAVKKAIRRKMIGMGPMVSTFEREFRKYVGAAEAIAVNSATAALHLSVDVLGIGAGDEVITTAMTFCSTILAIKYTGAKPVFADINSHDMCIDPVSVEKKVSPKTKAILIVHYAGYPCDLEAIIKICQKYNLALIEDAAHALPTVLNGKYTGADETRIRNLICFSFQATKTLSIGDGGMVTTSDHELAERIREKRIFGMHKIDDRQALDMTLQNEVQSLGYKYNMTDIEAAIGIVQLKKLNLMHSLREALVCRYKEILSDVPGLMFLESLVGGNSSWYIMAVRIINDEKFSKRDRLISYLANQGIKTTVHFRPVYQFPYFKKIIADTVELEVTDKLAGEVLTLPLYPAMTVYEVEYVANHIRKFFSSKAFAS
ncbi:MAG: DegT/DnrJ/EryC1/StrS family aminotransferase [Lachnospiraceae bacterium]|nr:DegT/DnrJ/EryC1/StrS family aminotransferase [Lachnospiraceae bacterium]